MYLFSTLTNPPFSFIPDLHTFLSQIRSHCSHHLRGIGGPLLKQAPSAKAKQGVAEHLLSRINHDAQEQERLQLYDPKRRELWFACADGRNCVYISSQGRLRIAESPLKSKLTREQVERIRGNSQAVDGSERLSQVTQVLEDYLYFKDERLYLHLALWIVGTYTYSIFSHYGYLWDYSKKPRCGKTRKQEVFSHLAYEASRPMNAPTPSSIRELAAEGGTVQLDTLERWKGKSQESYSAAMELLDAGYRNGGLVTKMVGDGGGDWKRKVYPVYAPYLLSGIHKDSLSETALDRSFPNEMHQKPLWIQKKAYKHFICEKECLPIREALYTFAFQNAKAVSQVYDSDELESQVGQLQLNDRAADIWKPLFTTLTVLGFTEESVEWTQMASLAREMHADPEIAEVKRQLAIVRALKKRANGDDKVVGITTELVDYLAEEGIQVHRPHELFKEWSFNQKSIRLNGEGPRRAWEIPVPALHEIEKQLVECLSPPKTVTTLTTKRRLN